MANRGYFCTSNRTVLTEATDIIVGTADGNERVWGDRYEALDGETLVIYRDDRVIQTYPAGTWPRGVESFGVRVEAVEADV